MRPFYEQVAELYKSAAVDLGPQLGGYSLFDLICDQTGAKDDSIRTAIATAKQRGLIPQEVN